jgi:hypothetical protein
VLLDGPDPLVVAVADLAAEIDDLAWELLRLPLPVLLGLSGRRTTRSAARWAWRAAKWLTVNPTDDDGNEWADWADGLCAAKWALLL